MQLNASRLGEMLLEAGLVDQFQLDSALSMQRNLGGRIGSAMVKMGYLPEATIMEFLESQEKIARVELSELEIPARLMAMIPAERLRHLLVIPIEWCQSSREKALRVAMTDPTNLRLVEELQIVCGCRVLPVLASEDEIRQALEINLSKTPVGGAAAPLADGMIEYDLADLGDLSPSGPCLDRLLDVLQQKGLLTANEIERVKLG